MAMKPAPKASETSVTSIMSAADIYRTHFAEYPDVLTAEQVSKILGKSTKTVHALLNKGEMQYFQIGRVKHIPKLYLLHFMKLIDRNVIVD